VLQREQQPLLAVTLPIFAMTASASSYSRRYIAIGAVATALLLTAFRSAPPVPNGLALTPPMGWNSWNHFGCNVSATLIRGVADAMAANGMREAGYRYVVIDDCWQVGRDASGTIIADSVRFPGGMKPLADYVHAKGLQFGIYTDAGRKTCEGRPGSYGFEERDAKSYAQWGVDYVKIDWCNAEGLDAPTQYAKLRDALAHSGRPIVFSICEWGLNRPWDWAPATGNLWRTTGDIDDSWDSMLANFDLSSQYAHVAKPGAWNDPDMLEIGNGGLSEDESRAHMSLWAIAAAPLIAGNDVRSMTDSSRDAQIAHEVLLNTDVIAVDQDALGIQARMVSAPRSDLQVWSRPLADGSRAVVLLNRASVPSRINASWGRIGISARGATRVRNLWTHKDSTVTGDSYSAQVPPHGVVMVRVWPGGAR
jgi:alpha-galactosidase